MPMKPNVSISESGRKYYLRDATLTNADIALHLTGINLVNVGDDMGGQGQPPGTFWIGGSGHSWGRLAAVRTANDEVVVLCPFHSSLGQKMLAIGDFVAGDLEMELAAETDPSHPLNLYESLVAGTR